MQVKFRTKRLLTGWAFLLALFFCLAVPRISTAEEEYRFERMWPTLQQPWYFYEPAGVAVDSRGYVYVADTRNDRIQKFTSEGQFVAKWGSEGRGGGDFNNPTGIAVDGDDYVYVADTYNSRIEKFTSDGRFVMGWIGRGSAAGELDFPRGVATDNSGYVYVADTNNNRIQKFTSDGLFVASWGIEGTGNGEFDEPSGISTDANGFIYVVDTRNQRIQKFTAEGQFVTKWGGEGSGDGAFGSTTAGGGPRGIAVDTAGFIYVADKWNQRIQKFTPDGQFVEKWGSFGSDPGEFFYPDGVTIDDTGNIYVADTSNDRIQKFGGSQFTSAWESFGKDDGKFNKPKGITADESGSIYVADTNNSRIQKFDSDGQFVATWGRYGNDDGQFRFPAGIAADQNGYIYVADTYGDRIKKLTSDGQFVATWGSTGSGNGEFWYPSGIAVDGSGFVYVGDRYNNRIQKLTSDGQFVTSWGSTGDGAGEFHSPHGVAVNGNGSVYVADRSNHRIQKFTSAGQFVIQWGSYGDGDGEFIQPVGVSVDSEGYVYVADSFGDRIQKFTSEGVFVGKWGGIGSGPGNLNKPHSMAIDSSGRVFVCDTENNRIQVFKVVTQTSNNKAVVVAGGGPYQGNHLWDATQMCATFAYRTLTYQGFTKESIYYLSADTDLDLDSNGVLDDVDADCTISNLQYALTTWASGADDLILYLNDHGGDKTFRLSDTETLSTSELNTWLNGVEPSIGGKIIIAYDACESGSFLSSLAPLSSNERIIISSTSPGESAYFVTQGSISFSNYFWTHIFNGLTVYDSFDLAQEAIGPYQSPLLDDSGNGIGNEAGDGVLAQSTYIGNGTMIQGDAPIIGDISPAQTVSNTSTAMLYADDVSDDDGIARVWAVIRPPDYIPTSPDNPIQELPSVELMPVGGDRYEATYNGFTSTGTYQVAVYARDRIGNTSVPDLTIVSVNSPLTRKAIIVAGGPPSGNIWTAIEKNVVLAYEALTYQGFSDDTIYFMSPVYISTGIDGLPTLSNLQYAVTNWATQNTQDLVLYLIGNGDEETFQLGETETVSAASLAAWLNTLQNTITGKITFLYDGCRSESFLPLLTPDTGKERILISSTGEHEPAYFLSDGSVCFSNYFWKQVLNGADVREAFIHAKQAISFSCQEQTPAIDDNGNGIGNEREDGQLAQNYTIGFGIMLAGDDPIIGSICPSQTLKNETSATIWVDNVTTTGTIDKVWALITPPNYNVGQPSNPVTSLPTLDLNHVGGGKYEGTYANFSASGTYKVDVYALDEDGNVSIPKQTEATLVPPLNVTSVSTNVTGPAAAGQPLQITFAVDGDGSQLYYKYLARSGYQTQNPGPWQLLHDWTPDSMLTWTPPNEGHYIFVVYATADTTTANLHQAGLSIATSGNSANPIQIADFTTDIGYPHSSEIAINIDTTATGGGDLLYYRYYYRKVPSDRWTEITTYGTNNTCTWTPPGDGLYVVVVQATDNPSGNTFSTAGMTCTIGQ